MPYYYNGNGRAYAAAGGGGGSGGTWGQNPASSTPCDIPGQPCSPVGSLGGTSQWCKCLASGGGGGAAPASGGGAPAAAGGTGGGGFNLSGISSSISSVTSKIKPYATYMLVGGIAMFILPMIIKKGGLSQLKTPGLVLAAVGAYLKFGSRFNLPGA